jgi:hypothetical protein
MESACRAQFYLFERPFRSLWPGKQSFLAAVIPVLIRHRRT